MSLHVFAHESDITTLTKKRMVIRRQCSMDWQPNNFRKGSLLHYFECNKANTARRMLVSNAFNWVHCRG